eukprot:UC4_evm3s1188
MAQGRLIISQLLPGGRCFFIRTHAAIKRSYSQNRQCEEENEYRFKVASALQFNLLLFHDYSHDMHFRNSESTQHSHGSNVVFSPYAEKMNPVLKGERKFQEVLGGIDGYVNFNKTLSKIPFLSSILPFQNIFGEGWIELHDLHMGFSAISNAIALALHKHSEDDSETEELKTLLSNVNRGSDAERKIKESAARAVSLGQTSAHHLVSSHLFYAQRFRSGRLIKFLGDILSTKNAAEAIRRSADRAIIEEILDSDVQDHPFEVDLHVFTLVAGKDKDELKSNTDEKSRLLLADFTESNSGKRRVHAIARHDQVRVGNYMNIEEGFLGPFKILDFKEMSVSPVCVRV